MFGVLAEKLLEDRGEHRMVSVSVGDRVAVGPRQLDPVPDSGSHLLVGFAQSVQQQVVLALEILSRGRRCDRIDVWQGVVAFVGERGSPRCDGSGDAGGPS